MDRIMKKLLILLGIVVMFFLTASSLFEWSDIWLEPTGMVVEANGTSCVIIELFERTIEYDNDTNRYMFTTTSTDQYILQYGCSFGSENGIVQYQGNPVNIKINGATDEFILEIAKNNPGVEAVAASFQSNYLLRFPADVIGMQNFDLKMPNGISLPIWVQTYSQTVVAGGDGGSDGGECVPNDNISCQTREVCSEYGCQFGTYIELYNCVDSCGNPAD
jgi:hypothetical protein